MKCAACHDDMEEKFGKIELRIHEKLFIVENVYYQECPSCGERTLSPGISQGIFLKIKNKEYKEKPILLPVIEGYTTIAV